MCGCLCHVVTYAYLYAINEQSELNLMGCGISLTRCHKYSGWAASSIVLMLVLQQDTIYIVFPVNFFC